MHEPTCCRFHFLPALSQQTLCSALSQQSRATQQHASQQCGLPHPYVEPATTPARPPQKPRYQALGGAPLVARAPALARSSDASSRYFFSVYALVPLRHPHACWAKGDPRSGSPRYQPASHNSPSANLTGFVDAAGSLFSLVQRSDEQPQVRLCGERGRAGNKKALATYSMPLSWEHAAGLHRVHTTMWL